MPHDERDTHDVMPELIRPIPNKLQANAVRVEFDPQKANIDSIMAVVKEILGRTGCAACGRLSILDIHFDPRVIIEHEIPGVRNVKELAP
jgi:formate dehydrogenase assembly factor FdhD